jgi:hypothetical protein
VFAHGPYLVATLSFVLAGVAACGCFLAANVVASRKGPDRLQMVRTRLWAAFVCLVFMVLLPAIALMLGLP